MSIRTHHFAPVSSAGRLHWQSYGSPTATMATAASPALAVTAGQPRSPFALLEQPIDLVVLVADHVNEPAVAAVLAALPRPLPVTVVLAAEPPDTNGATGVLALPAAAGMPIAEADHEGILVSGHVWIAPDARRLTLEQRGNAIHTVLHAPTVADGAAARDALLASAAATFGARTLVIVLSGSARDGLSGCAAIHAAGGRIVAVAHAAAILPAAIVEAGLAHAAWSPTELPRLAAGCIEHGRHDPRRERASAGGASELS